MLKYILKRIVIFLPTLFIISLLTFWLSKVAPGDPVEASLQNEEEEITITGKAYQQIYEQLGLNKPQFYFTFQSIAFPDTLYKIAGRYHQESLSNLISQYGNWDKIQIYNNNLESFYEAIETLPSNADKDKKIKVKYAAAMLLEEHRDVKISSFLESIKKNVLSENKDSTMHAQLGDQTRALIQSYSTLKNNPSRGKHYIPIIKWQGFNNQYHDWITSFLKGDFGISYRSGQPVLDRIKTPISWTVIISLIVIVLVYILSVPLGVFSAINKGSKRDKIITTILFLLFSLPTFWIATLLLVFFTNPEYGMNWFNGAGLGSLSSSAPFWDRFWETASHLILPIFCLTYGGLAFMSRQMRGGMLDVLDMDYIRTARAKGLGKTKIIWKHAFRNAVFPMITVFARVFPAAIVGAVVIEVIFNIPGMGREVFSAIFAKDWPVLYTILMMVAILTMVGNLVGDMLYALVDPRVKFK